MLNGIGRVIAKEEVIILTNADEIAIPFMHFLKIYVLSSCSGDKNSPELGDSRNERAWILCQGVKGRQTICYNRRNQSTIE